MRRSWLLLTFSVVALAGLAATLAMPTQVSPTTVTLDASTRYQTIDSWAVNTRYWEHDKENNRYDNSFAPHIRRVSEFLADEVGIDGVRVEIWSGTENPTDYWTPFFEGRTTYEEYRERRYEKINDNDDPFSANPGGFQFAKFDYRAQRLLALKHAVEANGERLHINVCYVDFKSGVSQGSLSHADHPEEFAEFVLIYFERLRDKYGIVPDSFEIILEPDNTEAWRGRQIGRAIVAVSERLKAHGFEPEIIAPSNARAARALQYFDEMVQVPGAVERLRTFAYHRYGLLRDADIEGVWQRAQAHGLKTAMLEKTGAGIDELLQDLTLAHVSSWQQWAVATLADREDKGAYYVLVDKTDPGHPRISMAERTHHLAHVFRYVRRGAVRIGATSDNSDKPTVAFINEDGTWVTVVRAQESGGPLNVVGLPAGRYGVSFTGEDHKTQHLPVVSIAARQTFQIQLPGSGVATVYSVNDEGDRV